MLRPHGWTIETEKPAALENSTDDRVGEIVVVKDPP
jgi:hypothetical protein